MDADVIVIGSGLAGVVATCEAVSQGLRVILVEQEPEQCLGGQAFWSLGGLFLVGTPLQKRMGIKDSYELAWKDWLGTAAFDRPEDHWPRKWAEAYVGFAAGEKYSWLKGLGLKFFPVVGWAERAGAGSRRGNSVPRFHVTWGTGPGLLDPFINRLQSAVSAGMAVIKYRHQVDELTSAGGVVRGVRGKILEPSDVRRGERSSRVAIADFSLSAPGVIIASGGIGGNLPLVRRNWPGRLGAPPKGLLRGVPEHVDGRMLEIAGRAGGNLINPDRMWHYTEGIGNWAPVWQAHGIRILPGPSSVWVDARGKRLPAPLFPGFDTRGTLEYLRTTGFDHSWFILNQKIIRKEFAFSGSEQNPELTGKDWWGLLRRIWRKSAPEPIESFKNKGADFVVRDNLRDLVGDMRQMSASPTLAYEELREEIIARDQGVGNRTPEDLQVTAIREARRYFGDRLIRIVPPHRILDPAAGPLIAVRLHILTRKTLGGLETNLDAQVMDPQGRTIPGLFAAGEAAGFGGGGMHGYSALEGSFLGGCLFSGRVAGRAVSRLLR